MAYWVNGAGPLNDAGDPIGNAEYKIHVDGRRARGSLYAEPDVLAAAYEAKSLTLILSDGQVLDIVVTSWSPGAHAEIAVNTPIGQR